ncbi:MAG: phage/plasmid primase, P4 family [Acidobacteria bacterium]|nr:phage/plasmid primase, P4 family [Acidobacteriota bacterium]
MSGRGKVLTADQIGWGVAATASDGFPPTEAGAAQSFTEAVQDRLRFDHCRNRWLIRSEHHWKPDADGAVIRLALDHARRQQRQALDIKDTFERGKAIEHWLKFDRRAALDNLLSLAKNLPPLADDGTNWDHNRGLIAFENGVVSLETGTLRPGKPEDKITLSTGFSFDPDASCPRWERFIKEVIPDPAVADFMWRAFGYAITGDMREQVFFLLFGRGCNGKSTLMDVIESVLGDYALTVPFSAFEQDRAGSVPADVASLDGKRLVKASEGTPGRWLHSSRLKDITGGERVSARHLYGNPFTFRPVCKVFLSTNELPKVGDDSDGLWRRLRQVPFTQRFEGTADDRSLKDTLLAEAPGILAWLVRGCLEWQTRGLGVPAAVADATAEYRADCDPLARFFDEACRLELGVDVGASDLFRHYRQWAERAGLSEKERLSATAFGRKCVDRFMRSKTRGGMVYQGVSCA